MAEVAQGTQEEFWRPPTLSEEVAVRDPHPTMAEACPCCGTEFLLGSKFCHSCGGRRPAAISSSARADAAALAGLWERAIDRIQAGIAGVPWNKAKFPSWMRHLHFHEIKSRLVLSTASLIAFVIGLSCVSGAVLVGALYSVKTWIDFQAGQYFRAQWFLAATASLVSGMLLN